MTVRDCAAVEVTQPWPDVAVADGSSADCVCGGTPEPLSSAWTSSHRYGCALHSRANLPKRVRCGCTLDNRVAGNAIESCPSSIPTRPPSRCHYCESDSYP